MTFAEFDQLPFEHKKQILFRCCGAHEWVKSMLNAFPVQNLGDLLEYAEENWYECNHSDWLEAFENLARLGAVNGSAPDNLPQFAQKEQQLLLSSDESVIKELSDANREYEETFGYMFITYAAGKSAEKLLSELRERLHNDPRDEIQIAAAEENKIIRSRLSQLFS